MKVLLLKIENFSHTDIDGYELLFPYVKDSSSWFHVNQEEYNLLSDYARDNKLTLVVDDGSITLKSKLDEILKHQKEVNEKFQKQLKIQEAKAIEKANRMKAKKEQDRIKKELETYNKLKEKYKS